MSENDRLVSELIQTLEIENKTKIHQIFLITQQLNDLVIENKQLKQQEALLAIHNTQLHITIQKQTLEMHRLSLHIQELENKLKDKQTTIATHENTINQFKKHERSQQNQDSVYNLLMTNYFEQPKAITPKPSDEKLKHQIIEKECRIQQLQYLIKDIEGKAIEVKLERDEEVKESIREMKKWEIQYEQLSIKNKHLAQSLKLVEQRNIELGRNVKELSEVRYTLQIKINTMTMNQQELSQQVQYFRQRNLESESEIQIIRQKSTKDNLEILLFNQTINQLEMQLNGLKEENNLLLGEHEELKRQLNNILNTKVDIEHYRLLEKEHESLKIDLELLRNQLQLKGNQLEREQNQDRDLLKSNKEEISHLIAINFTLSSEVSMLRQRLLEEEERNREAMRLERVNRSLMRRVELLQTSMHEKRKSSTKIDSLLHLPSVASIPSVERISESKNKSNLIRIKSEQNLGKLWNREELKGSSRVKNIFSSRQIPSMNEKSRWKNLQERIQSLKYQNEDLKRHLSFHKL